ncbi:MAG: transposase [Candidatus Binataceae bacterium]
MRDIAVRGRRSIRLRGFDYRTDAAYFVTICTFNRQCLLAQISDGHARLSEVGEIVAASWKWLEEHFQYPTLDEFIVMPNHIHGILITGHLGGSRTAPTTHKPLGRLLGAFKTVSSKRINLVRGTPGAPLWQRNYYERVIRSEEELQRIREYVAGNPAAWESDPQNPARSISLRMIRDRAPWQV